MITTPNIMKMNLSASTSILHRASFTARRVRNFHSLGALKSSPYHYPEGPRSNIPFNPLTRFFIVRYWTFMAVGFCAPFGIAVWQTYKS
ncbi:Cytochrome c oxidase subunit 8, mitochondrial [Erysiphe necator]|uniref:Cytochrome c oxidase subunit 8, mitochondrial n=1 Tax=Uncinula necator TaxID=52586 RepID=A0A0B1P293_UNCNE|nr:Cytochrome c oxidase subunit 8, mitochondrial [Erysiphe necator]KHJ32398.1 putative cytochrome-c oxidase chain viic [Erysiphe necator]